MFGTDFVRNLFDELVVRVRQVAGFSQTVGALGSQLQSLLPENDLVPAVVGKAQRDALANWQRNVGMLRQHVGAMNTDVGIMQRAAADRQTKFMQVSVRHRVTLPPFQLSAFV